MSAAPAKADSGLELEARAARLGRPLLMGVVNLTPDSFHPPSRAAGAAAVAAAARLEEEGADILDLGAESTFPGSLPVPVEEESRRLLPVLESVAARVKTPISVDTYKAEIARRALSAGARILNDVTALRGDPAMPAAAVGYPRVILMHMQGESPRTMQDAPRYGDVVEDVLGFLRERLAAFERAGGDVSRAWIDPGIGFGKTTEHNLALLRGLERLRVLGRPILVGASRKFFVGRILGSEARPVPPENRLEGSLAAASRAAEAGALCLRVHDAAATRRYLEVWRRLR